MMTDNLADLLAELTSGDDERAEAAIPRLAKNPQAPAALEKLLQSGSSDERWWGIRALAEMKTPPSEWLLKALDDPSEEVRQCALLALTHHPAEAALERLLRYVCDPDSMTTHLAATALIALGNPAVPGMLEMLETMPGAGNPEIMRALATIADARAVPALMKALEQDSPAMQFWAEQGLEKLGLGMVYLEPD